MATLDTSNIQILFIGHNSNGEFGVDDIISGDDTVEFIECPNKEFKRIFSGAAFNIFTDDTLTNLWSCGCNRNGKCGVGHKTAIQSCQRTDYLQKNNIKLNKICTNISAECIFYISDKYHLYICGMMKGLQIADQPSPKKLPFQDVINAQATDRCMVVLCGKNSDILYMIITNWSRSYSIPDDITKILLVFCKATTIYSTTNLPGSGHPNDYGSRNKYGWNEVKFFSDKYIVKIKSGEDHMLFLDETGVVYSCGKYAGMMMLYMNQKKYFLRKKMKQLLLVTLNVEELEH